VKLLVASTNSLALSVVPLTVPVKVSALATREVR
jgi:hypothetical protein